MKRPAPFAPRLVLAGALAVLAGCAVPGITPPPPADAPGRFAPLTAPIIALGDTQEHESTGFPLLDNDGAVDSYVEVAQRPPEAPLFSRRILEWVVENHPHEPLIHLGDVLDMSCRSELKRMLKLGMAMRQPGVVLPGNHDGLLFGIFNHDVTDIAGDKDARRWNMGCRSPIREGVASPEDARGQAVTKRDFIGAYLELAAARLDPGHGLVPPARTGIGSVSWRNPDDDAFLMAVEARVNDGRLYASSFMAQLMRLPKAPGAKRAVRMVGLDTNQLLTIVGALDAIRRTSPGDIGSVDPDQVDAVAPWFEAAIAAGDIVILAGHHNWDHLSPVTRFRLGQLLEKLPHPLVYVSAHTHRGYWALHHVGERPLLELNVSSLSDWPIAYRRLSFELDEDANRIKVVGELLPRELTAPASDAELLRAWGAQTCAKVGVPVGLLADEEIAAVRNQKRSRGQLWEWLVAHFDESCESCQRILFDHAHAYQDQMLTTISQLVRDIGPDASGIASVDMPGYCGAKGVEDCATDLRSREAATLPEYIRRFREKARLVDRVNDHLDDLRDPKAKAYMACRAVLGAKADFDETPEGDTPGRSEAFRRAGAFFRIEATVGMR
ncbi:MAG: hypothetical protein IPJ28_12270 [Betaproteobacteria bacterium]|nr:hypothetical protein [Betaproteobacteria bacterium]